MVSSAGRNTTLIFFSWIDDFAVCSMLDHYLHVSKSSIDSKGTYKRRNVGELFVCSNENGLHEELVPAFGIWRRVLLHCLEQDCTVGQRLPRTERLRIIVSYSALRHSHRAQCDQSLAEHSIYGI